MYLILVIRARHIWRGKHLCQNCSNFLSEIVMNLIRKFITSGFNRNLLKISIYVRAMIWVAIYWDRKSGYPRPGPENRMFLKLNSVRETEHIKTRSRSRKVLSFSLSVKREFWKSCQLFHIWIFCNRFF